MYVHTDTAKRPSYRSVTVHTAPLAPLSRDEAVARLHGRQVIDLERAARRRRTLEAAIVIGNSTREG